MAVGATVQERILASAEPSLLQIKDSRDYYDRLAPTRSYAKRRKKLILKTATEGQTLAGNDLVTAHTRCAHG